jgi:hypothetical protein
MNAITVVGMSSSPHYGEYHNYRGKLVVGDHYRLTVVCEDPSDPTFKRVGTFVYTSERACSKASISASRKGNAVIWFVE